MTVLQRFDPIVIPYCSFHVALPLGPDEVLAKLRTLVAPSGTPPSDTMPFRGEVGDEGFMLEVRLPTSGLARGINHERSLALFWGAVTKTAEGSELRFAMRQPIPAFALLAAVWFGFVYTIVNGSSPALLMTPLTGHVVLVFFFRLTIRQRALGPLSQALGVRL